MNDSYYRMIGEMRENRQDIEQSSILNYVHEDDLDGIRAAVDRCIDGSEEETIDYRIYCGDGIYRWFRMAASVVKREKERITLYCGYANINDTIAAQEALKKANIEIQKQYSQELSQRKMLENDSMVAVQFNVTQDKLISYRVNQGIVKEYDKGTIGSLIRPDLSQSIPTEEERRIAAEFYDVPKAVERFQNGIKEFSAEYRRRLNDGRLHWLRSTCRLALDEETGDLISYTYLRNIDTERKKEQTAESVIDNETDFVILLNTVSDTAMLLRLRDRYKDISQELYTEYPFDDVINSDKFGMVEPENRREVAEFFEKDSLLQRLKAETVATIIYRYRYNDGTVRLKKTRAFYLDSTQEDIVIARRDITDIYEEEQAQQRVLQRALDEAKRASRAKSDFLSRMSHDLRTPMNVIIGLTSMAMDRPDKSREMEEMLSNITSSAKYLLSLINDCLDLEKITSDKIELHPAPYSYEDFYDNAQAVIGPLCRQKGITFILEERNEKHPVILADKMRMEQIFYNLMSNAVKFTPSGGRVEFLLHDRVIDGDFNSFSCVIRDTGIGMSEEFQKHMFEAFAQETNTVTPEYQGSGLGLTIVKQLADLMNAEISVRSKLGEGTEFTIRFCFPLAKGFKKTEREKSFRFTPEQLRGKRVLLAEDHPLNSMIAVKLLEKMDMAVTTAANGQEAVDKFISETEGYFDAILMDIRMPVMNGLEAARAIRAIDRADAKTIPIIAMTANAFETDIEESLRAGMDAHLSKPIETPKLYEALAEHIK